MLILLLKLLFFINRLCGGNCLQLGSSLVTAVERRMADLQMQLSEMRVRCCLSALADRERILIFHCQILAYHRCIPLDSYLKNPGGELKTSVVVKVIVLPKGPSFVI